MKVVFLRDVPNVASAGDIKEVADGYGRNFLIPKKLAVIASSLTTNVAETQRRIEAQRQATANSELEGLASQLEGKEIILKARTRAKDRLYGSITNTKIASEIESTLGIAIDKRKIELDEPIHQLGSYEVAIRLDKDILPKITVTVVEKEAEESV